MPGVLDALVALDGGLVAEVDRCLCAAVAVKGSRAATGAPIELVHPSAGEMCDELKALDDWFRLWTSDAVSLVASLEAAAGPVPSSHTATALVPWLSRLGRAQATAAADVVDGLYEDIYWMRKHAMNVYVRADEVLAAGLDPVSEGDVIGLTGDVYDVCKRIYAAL